MSDSHLRASQLQFSPSLALWILFGLLLMMMAVTALITGGLLAVPGISPRTAILLSATVQNLIAFVVPAWVACRLVSQRPWHTMGARKAPAPLAVAVVVLVYFLSIPMLNQLVYCNDHITFPESLRSLETTLRQWEDSAASTQHVLLEGSSVGVLFSGIAVVGILTGLCEEIFFRGALQRLLAMATGRKWVAVLIAAIIFSTLHFQFFGFVPRLAMGFYFGFMLAVSGSLWTAALAHAINNSMVVACAWAQANGFDASWIEHFGVASEGFPWLAAASALASVAVLAFYYKFSRPASQLPS